MSRTGVWLLFAVTLSAIAAACQTAPVQRFPHQRHLEGIECGGPGRPDCLSCATCHAGVRDSERSAMPERSLCARCHEQRTVAMPVAVTEGRASDTGIVFSHRQHLDQPRIRGQCMHCHAGVVRPTGITGTDTPSMAVCLVCHQKEFDEGRCSPCHVQRALLRLVPETFMQHSPSWIRGHGLAASQSRKVCMQCHSETHCADCHDQNQRFRVDLRKPDDIESGYLHRADFITRHTIEARSQPASCLRCHATASCDACHVQRGVSAGGTFAQSPHPQGWIGPDTQNRNFHGRAARRDIMSCAGCHDQGLATNCIRCHRVGGSGGNPHPDNWKSARSPDASMCRFCHEK
jgi:hypothetical protein